jgi:Protein of unknown function (DUF1549)/Protein of unknown function (DUF1553)
MKLPRSLRCLPVPAVLAVVMAMVPAGVWANAKEAAPGSGDSKAQPIDMASVAAKIDALVVKGYADHKVTPTRPTNDAEFLRRVYLDAAGRIPTLEETRAFLGSSDPHKRAKLVDQLLDSPGYNSQMYNFWGDLLRIQSRMRGDETQSYPEWVKASIKQNKPYDKMVYEMLTASGNPRDDGAAGYWLRDQGMTLDTVAITAQAFLGTKIGCAQCHDHPFDDWTQKDFYQFAAFAEQVTTRGNRDDPRLRELRSVYKSKDLDPKVRQALQRLTRPLQYGVSEDSRKKLHLPNDYKYNNAKPGSAVEAKVIFGDLPHDGNDQSEREVFARWLTSKDNPRFAKAIANRMWKKVMGFGLVEPVDEFYNDTQGANPALLAYLTQLMKDVNFDLKAFQRVLLNSKTYQLTVPHDELTRDTYFAQGAVLRRMSAEQLWDSCLTLAVPNPDVREGPPSLYGRDQYMMKLLDECKTGEDILALAKKMVENEKEFRAKAAAQLRERARDRGRGGFAANLARASEMPAPAQPGTFLEEFGQSDREGLNRGSAEPSVPQALTLINGQTVPLLTGRQSQLMQAVADAKSTQDKVEVIYLSILNRQPATGEMDIALDEVKAHGEQGYGNLVWALINSREFIFVR